MLKMHEENQRLMRQNQQLKANREAEKALPVAEQKKRLKAQLLKLTSVENIEVKRKRRRSSARFDANAIAAMQYSNEKKKPKRRMSKISGQHSSRSRRSSKSSNHSSAQGDNASNGFNNPSRRTSKLPAFVKEDLSDKDDDDDARRNLQAPQINIESDGTKTQKQPKRRRSRRMSNSLRRDSRSGARAVSPAAFLQY